MLDLPLSMILLISPGVSRAPLTRKYLPSSAAFLLSHWSQMALQTAPKSFSTYNVVTTPVKTGLLS